MYLNNIDEAMRKLQGAEPLVVLDDGPIIEPIIAKTVKIVNEEIKSTILAERVHFEGDMVVISEGGSVICGKLYHSCNYKVAKGGSLEFGVESFKLGTRCCNYTERDKLSALLALLKGD